MVYNLDSASRLDTECALRLNEPIKSFGAKVYVLDVDIKYSFLSCHKIRLKDTRRQTHMILHGSGIILKPWQP